VVEGVEVAVARAEEEQRDHTTLNTNINIQDLFHTDMEPRAVPIESKPFSTYKLQGIMISYAEP
jgi:hypothetical protein